MPHAMWRERRMKSDVLFILLPQDIETQKNACILIKYHCFNVHPTILSFPPSYFPIQFVVHGEIVHIPQYSLYSS